MSRRKPTLSLVIPCFNEADNIAPMHRKLHAVINAELSDLEYELVYVNDGSSDKTDEELAQLAQQDDHVRVLTLSRNFGKEIAMTAGLQYAIGEAILTLDGDGQHPPELIPRFVTAWREGNKVVIGVRITNQAEGMVKHYGSKLFYRIINHFSQDPLVPGSTDFRLIDRVVQQEFIKLTEHGRMTRGLIDWLGFKREYISFDAPSRMAGKAAYDFKKLIQLAVDSFVSVSLFPLYISLYVGLIIVPVSLLVGLFSTFEMIIGDPLGLRVHGTAFVALLILFAVGILLISQGFIALYLSRVHTETQNRPLFVIDREQSFNLEV